jgi:hypothetical protein
MIGAGGYSGSPVADGGGYIRGSIMLPPATTSIKVVVGAGSGAPSLAPAGASYINVPGSYLFAMAGASGNDNGGNNGGYGGGGTFTLGVANGGDGNCSGSGGTISGGLGYNFGCSTLNSSYDGGNPGSSGLYEEAIGGNDINPGTVIPGGSGYAGGGGVQIGVDSAGGGGSSYINTAYTTVITSYDGASLPPTLLPGYGRPTQNGYVSITFNPGCDNVSLRTDGDIVTRNIYTSSVQIGITGNPIAFPLEINQNTTTSTLTSGYRYGSTSSGAIGVPTSYDINVRSVSGIWAANFYASSDQRIKTNIKDINDDQALQVVRGLQPVCYNYIDPIRHHNQLEYGFIAQQVKSLLPHAVRTETEFVPNIYDLADFSALGSDATMVTLRHRTIEHIQVNDVVKILDLKEKPLTYQITDVNYNYFTIDANLSTIVSEYELTEEDVKNGIQKNTVFVYGTRVDDFHVLDKHAIYSVSIGALQEMDRTIQRQALRIAELETQHTMRIKQLEDKIQLLLLPESSASASDTA